MENSYLNRLVPRQSKLASLKGKSPGKEPWSKLRGISEVAVDRRATVQKIPALGHRRATQKTEASLGD
jgi:hypothetical protein